MRRFVMCLAIIAMGAAPALAGPKENAMSNLAQATAVEFGCPQYRTNLDIVAAISERYRIGGGADQDAIVEEARRALAAQGDNPEAFCVAGWLLYGRDGSSVKNLILKD